GMLRRHAYDRLPVGQRVARAGEHEVRGDAQDAGAHLGLEAVHHGKHYDQHRHPERDADHGDERDEADKAVAALCACIAQADHEHVTHDARESYNRSAGMDADTQASLARLLTTQRIAHLATLRAGAPMASMTLYLPEARFAAFYVHVSRLA